LKSRIDAIPVLISTKFETLMRCEASPNRIDHRRARLFDSFLTAYDLRHGHSVSQMAAYAPTLGIADVNKE
jgi:hypothetical protein